MTNHPPPACRLTVVLGEGDRSHHTPLYAEIVHRAQQAGLAGASVFRGIEGFGGSRTIHTTRLLSVSEGLPVSVVIVDRRERIAAFLPQLDDIAADHLVTVEPVTIHRPGMEPFPAGDQG